MRQTKRDTFINGLERCGQNAIAYQYDTVTNANTGDGEVKPTPSLSSVQLPSLVLARHVTNSA